MHIKTPLLITLIIGSTFNSSFAIGNDSTHLRSRKRQLESTEPTTVLCKSGRGLTCTCPGGCMIKPQNDTNYCTLKSCWKWDPDESACKGTGPKFTPAIVLQGIPFTGIFGSGFGNMGRWDLFAIGSCIWGGFFALACLASAFVAADDQALSGWISCWNCLFSTTLLVYYIWGIVTIANKTVLGPHGCPFAPDS